MHLQFTAALLMFLACTANVSLADGLLTASALRQELTGEPIEGGFLFVDGEYLPPPYVVSWSDNTLRINGFPLGSERANSRESEEYDGAAGHRRSRQPEALIGNLERRLSCGQLIIGTKDGRVSEFGGVDAAAVLTALLSDRTRAEQVAVLLKIPGHELGSRDWGRLLDRIEPTGALRARHADLLQQLDARANGFAIVHDGTTRSYSFALTVVGMVLVVLAFGTVLTFRPAAGQVWRAQDHSPLSIQLVNRSVVLMCVLSLFDLLCTYFARSAGQFSELNPLADTLLDHPVALIGFKVALTALAAVILWRLRYYRGTQLASWWLCLLLTLLAVRWVAVESLLMA